MNLQEFIQSLKAKTTFYIVVKTCKNTLYRGYSDKIPEELLIRKVENITTNCALQSLVVYIEE